MKSTKGLGRTSILMLCLFSVIVSGCNETPVDVPPSELPAADAETAVLDAFGIDQAALEGVDAAAITRAINLDAIAAALEEDTFASEPSAGKLGSFIVVEPGESIQAAVAAAPDYAILIIKPGLYQEAILIDKPLALIGWPGHGAQKVVIENPGGAENGITILDTENVALVNLTVRGFENNGVFALRVDGFLMLRLEAIDNGEYGLFPVRSSNGILAYCSATGSADAGLYVGQSENVLLQHNTAYGNVIGIEIENAVRIAVTHNKSYRNTAGMLAVFLPPGGFISFLEASELLIAHNHFTNNNLENFAHEGLAAVVPSGSGLLVIGFNQTRVRHNRVRGNDFVGIGVGSTEILSQLLPGNPPIVGIEPDPDDVRVRHNVVKNNGTAESPLPGFPAVDLFWDGTGTGNCWEENTFDTSFPPALPACEAVL